MFGLTLKTSECPITKSDLSFLLDRASPSVDPEYAALGRFAVRDMKQTAAARVVRVVEKKQVEAKNGK
jgi:hypothetical protein